MTLFLNKNQFQNENITTSSKDDLSKITILVLNALKNIITHKDIQIDMLQYEILNENSIYIEDLKGKIESYLSQSLFMNNIGMILSSYIIKESNSERLYFIKKLIKIFYSVPLSKLKYIFNIIKNMIKLNMNEDCEEQDKDKDKGNKNFNNIHNDINHVEPSFDKYDKHDNHNKSYERILPNDNIYSFQGRIQKNSNSQPELNTNTNLISQSQSQSQLQSKLNKQNMIFSAITQKETINKEHKEREINIDYIKNNLYLSKKHVIKNLSNQETDNTSINNLSREGLFKDNKKYSLNSIQYERKEVSSKQANRLDIVDFSLSNKYIKPNNPNNLKDMNIFDNHQIKSKKMSLDLKLSLNDLDENMNLYEEERNLSYDTGNQVYKESSSKINLHKEQKDKFLFDPLTIDQHKNEKIKFDFSSVSYSS